MPDWTRSMKQTFEYYIVDPGTWKDKEKVDRIESCSIVRDSTDSTLGSASIVSEDDFSDKYIRAYLVTEQDGIEEREALGTHLYQSPSIDYTSNRHSSSQSGYTPLIELTEKMPPYGYSLFAGTNIMDMAGYIAKENVRAPVVNGASDNTLADNFISDINDTWLIFLQDLIANDNHRFSLDSYGNIMFEKEQSIDAVSPIWTFDDGNSSILYPDVTLSRDLYGIPNVVEAIYSSPKGQVKQVRVVNDDVSSPTSVQSRGREVVYRDTSPNVTGNVTEAQLEEYARNVLKALSALEYTVTYKHGYCPVKLGDCVLLDYASHGLKNVKARVTRQVINCTTGCAVEETAVFSQQLWG